MPDIILCACGCGQEVPKPKFPSQQRKYINFHQHRGKHNGNYHGGKVKKACGICGKTFEVTPAMVDIRKTCGNDECYRKWQGLTTSARGQNKQKIHCDYCDNPLWRFPSQIKKYNFCNRFCQAQHHSALFNGPNAGNWNGGDKKYWKKHAMIRDNHRCVICGFDIIINVHHIIPKIKGGTNYLDNLITLCPNHHKMADLEIIDVSQYRRTDWTPEMTVANH